MRREKYFPRSRAGTHSCTQEFHDTPATAAKQLEMKNQRMSQRAAMAGSARGIHGKPTPSITQSARWMHAAVTVTVFGGRQRAINGAAKIWKKLAMKGIAVSSPIAGLGKTKALVTSAVMNTLTGSDIVTIGMATMPSTVHKRKLRARSCFFCVAEVFAMVAFNVERRAIKGRAADNQS